MLLTPEQIMLIRTSISKAVEENKAAISLRETIVLSCHLYLDRLKSVLGLDVDGTDADSIETYTVARTALQELVGVFGITVDLETMKNKEPEVANDTNKVSSNDNGPANENNKQGN